MLGILEYRGRFSTLVFLRNLLLPCFLLALVTSPLFYGPVHKPAIFLLIFFAVSNLVLYRIGKTASKTATDRLLFPTLLVDTVILAFILILNGGASNPFTIFFIAISSVGALLLPLWQLVFLVLACLLSLGFIYGSPAEHAHHHGDFGFHLQGMWLANSLGIFIVCGWIISLRRLNLKLFITHEKTKKVLFHFEKLESMGKMAGLAAHELNTPLATLQLGISEFQDKTSPLKPEEKEKWLEDMQKAVDQMGQILAQMKQESKPSNPEEKTDLEDFINQWVENWAGLRKAGVIVTFEARSLEVTSIFASDLSRVLSSLLDNALEAKSKTPISVVVSDQKHFLKLSIKDTGLGMDAETLRKISEPFYTTKPKGTGLGLYSCRETSKKYGGSVVIQSAPGSGTQVDILFGRNLL